MVDVVHRLDRFINVIAVTKICIHFVDGQSEKRDTAHVLDAQSATNEMKMISGLIEYSKSLLQYDLNDYFTNNIRKIYQWCLVYQPSLPSFPLSSFC